MVNILRMFKDAGAAVNSAIRDAGPGIDGPGGVTHTRHGSAKRESTMDGAKNERLEAFNQALAGRNLRGQWIGDAALEALKEGPAPVGIPFVWRFAEVERSLIEACTALPESFTARRHLSFANPGYQRGTTHTLHMGIQLIQPGETAWSHRHSIDALRFVINGDAKLHSNVAGEVCTMLDYDLIRTPNWCWHDHRNDSDHNVCWIDIVDSQIVNALSGGFYDTLGEARQPARNAASPKGGGLMRPVWSDTEAAQPVRPSFRYAWTETEARLKERAAEDGSPFDGIALEYVNPENGGPTFDRMTCWAQMLRPGEETRAHRHTSSAVYFVVRGEGATVVGDTEIEWQKHDSFVVPNWSWHRHLNRSRSDEAVLFSTNDMPAMQKLGLYREQAAD